MQSYDITEWGQPLQERLRPTPRPGAGQILVRLSHCGVCHSDVHVRQGWFDMGGGTKMRLADRGTPLPLTLGHEPIGRVQAVGEGANASLIGRQVIVNPWIGCGECAFCRDGRDNLCNQMRALGVGAPGGFSTHLLVPHERYLVDAEGLDPATSAVLACSGVTAYSAISKFGPLGQDDWVAVIGCGGVGLMAVSILEALGHPKVVACDLDDKKLQLALASGAEAAINLRSHPGPDELLRISGGGLKHMVDFVGAPETVQLALPSLLKGGQMVVVGLFGGALQLPLPALAMREVNLRGSVVGTTSHLRHLVDLVRAGRLQLPQVDVRPLAAAESSLCDLERGLVMGRVVLEMPLTAD